MAYDDDRITSEAAHQVDHKNAVTSADHLAADVNHYKRLAIAGAKWGISNGSLQALEALGVTFQAPNGYR